MRAALAMLALLGCRPVQGTAAVVAPVGTRVAVVVKNRTTASGSLRVLDVGTGTLSTTDTSFAATSVASLDGSYYVTTERPAGLFGAGSTFSLSGFVPSLVRSGAHGLLVISRDVSSTSRIAVWEPFTGSTKRVDWLVDAVPVSACDLDEGRWLVLGSGLGTTAAVDQMAIVTDDGARDAQFSSETFASSTSAELLGIAGCATDGEAVAVLFVGSANVLLLRRSADVLIPTGVISLPGGIDVYERIAPVFVGGVLAMATRSEEVLLLSPSGENATRLRFAGSPRVLARMAGALLVGSTAGLVLHSFDGSDDIALLELGADEEIVDVVVTAPQGL